LHSVRKQIHAVLSLVPGRLRLSIFAFLRISKRVNALTICFYAIPNAKPLRTFAGIAPAVGSAKGTTRVSKGMHYRYSAGSYSPPPERSH
ncbi:hypothetical protein AB4144_28715, partial [Rhizobiaceae sp. 2RAB30]